MRKFLMLMFAALVVCLAMPHSGSAEQAAADHYRQLINSGKFFIEYGTAADVQGNKSKRALMEVKYMDDHNKKQLACDGDRRMLYSMFRMMDAVKGKLAEVKQGKFLPAILYQDGKYYQFYGKNSAVVGYEEEFFKDYVNPREGWTRVNSEVKLPGFFVAIMPNSPNVADSYEVLRNMRNGEFQITANSEFVESGTATVFGQTFNYDKYLVKRFTPDGNELGKAVDTRRLPEGTPTDFSETYTYYYDADGVLRYVKEDNRFTRRRQQINQQPDAQSDTGVYTRIYSFTNAIPTGFFNFPAGCNVYRMDLGTLEDLLEIPQLVETH